jgi:hypothetical protein
LGWFEMFFINVSIDLRKKKQVEIERFNAKSNSSELRLTYLKSCSWYFFIFLNYLFNSKHNMFLINLIQIYPLTKMRITENVSFFMHLNTKWLVSNGPTRPIICMCSDGYWQDNCGCQQLWSLWYATQMGQENINKNILKKVCNIIKN